MTVRVYVVGRVCLEVDGRVVVDERRFRGKQGRLAFAFLTIPADTSGDPRGVGRRRVARPDGLAGGAGLYQIILPTDAWTDLEAASSAVDQAEGALRIGHPERVLGPGTVALNITRRSFLSGIEGEWADSRRRRLERQLIRALDCIAQMWLALDEPTLAVETSLEAVELDPYRESSHQHLMRAYGAQGNQANAVGVYHRLRRVLARDLGTGPSAATDALYRSLLA